jgi:hypothetical protein
MESPIKKIATRVSRSNTKFSEKISALEEDEDSCAIKSEVTQEKKKDKKLVFLSRSVLQSVRQYP